MPITINGTAGIQDVLGSASAPALSNTTSSNTGLYFPTSTTLGLSTNGTAALTIDASQRVGIGTTSPTYKLDVFNSGTTTTDFIVRNGTVSLLSFVDSGAGYTGTTTSHPLLFTTAATERMRIDSSGNVGIGATSLNLSASTKALTINSSSAGDYSALEFATAGTLRAYMNATNGAFYIASQSTNPMIFYTNASERMRIDSSGNVGIGTSSPSYKLEVQGSVNNYLGQRIYNTNSGSSAVSYLQIGNDSNGATAQLGLNSSTNTTNFGGANALYLANGLSAPISFATANTERMRIDSSGNLLVGTTSTISGLSASTKIQVLGYVGASGYNSRSGTSGSNSGNNFNLYWNGSAMRLYVDATDLGSITTSSDYRVKTQIKTQTLSALDRITQLRPVTYVYDNNEQLHWKSDGVQREGFIAHELAEIIPSAVDGVKDAENQVQSLRLDALCSVLVKAIQELKAELDALKGTK